MPEPTVRDLLLHDLDELVAAVGGTVDAVGNVVDQLRRGPVRAGSRCV
jgi:hypothetical protein